MRKRDKCALALPSLLLRVMLAVTFIWAGLGKLRATENVDREQAAVLANMGVVAPPAASPADPNTPIKPLPTPRPVGVPIPEPKTPEDGRVGADQAPSILLAAMQPDAKPATTPPPAASPTPPASSSGGTYSPQDFPESTTVTRVYKLSILMYNASHPKPNADGKPGTPIWPVKLGEGRAPVYLAWAVAITEVAGGAMVLIGLLTRLWSLALTGVMLGAMWLTQIGPALASGDTLFGFLPNRPIFGVVEWNTLLWQFALIASSLALFFAGPGLLAVDNAIFGKERPADDHDGE